jgi:hypothetical protein
VPGLPGITQKGACGGLPPRPPPAGGKRKAAPAAAAASPESSGDWPSQPRPASAAAAAAAALKRPRVDAPPPPLPRSLTQRGAAAAAAAASQPAAAGFAFPPLPPADLEGSLEAMAANYATLEAHCEALQREVGELKAGAGGVAAGMDAMLGDHDALVRAHGERAAALAAHWKEEADRLAALVRELGGEERAAAARRLEADLLAAQATMAELEAARLERDRSIVELQKRNAFLERHARVVATADKCVGGGAPGADAGCQAPSAGPGMLAARAMAPEGAPGSAAYAYGGAAGGPAAHAMAATYSLEHQRTGRRPAPAGGSGSNMRLASGGAAGGGPGALATAESVQHAADAARRRGSAPPALLRQQLLFASLSRSGGLAPVAEAPEGSAASAGGGAAAPAPAGSLPPRSGALLYAAGLASTPLPGGRYRFTHEATGFAFELGPAAAYPDLASDDDDDDAGEMAYKPVALPRAVAPFLEPELMGSLLGDGGFRFQEAQREVLMTVIEGALAKAKAAAAAAR